MAAVATSALAEGRTYQVKMSMLAFTDVPATARVGDTIEWVNADIFRHTATAKDGSFDVDLAPNATGRTVLSKAGVLDIYCRYHPDMKARIVVQAKRPR